MAEDADEIADRLRSTRQEFGGQVRQLSERPRNVQWRSYYEREPWLFVAAAFAGGLLLSAALRGRRRSSVHGDDRLERAADAATDGGSRGPGPGTIQTWDRIKAALLAAAGSQISSFVREIVPVLFGPHQSTRPADASASRAQNGSGIGGGNGQATPEVT